MEKRIFLVGREAVSIIQANAHTYNVRFLKSGKFMEVHKRYVRSVKIDSSKRRPKKASKATKPINSTQVQTRLDL